MRWIVTGATGLIGRHLVPAIAATGSRVTAWSRTAADVRPGDGPLVDFRNVDLALAAPPVDGEDDVGVVMLAAQISGSKDPADLPGLLEADALPHTALAASLGSRLKHVVYASSCTVYGYIDHGASREADPLRPLNAYAIEKAAAEFMLEGLARTQGFGLSVLRIAQVYGPGAPDAGALYGFLDAAVSGQPVVVNAGPGAFRDYIHVDDVVHAISLAIDARASCTVNIGTGPIRIADAARVALQVSGRSDDPQVLARSSGGNMALDWSLAHDRLGFEPTVSLETGLARELARVAQSM